jgi:hypothetical protein
LSRWLFIGSSNLPITANFNPGIMRRRGFSDLCPTENRRRSPRRSNELLADTIIKNPLDATIVYKKSYSFTFRTHKSMKRKYCYGHKRKEPISHFHKNRAKRDGYQAYCKAWNRDYLGTTLVCAECSSSFYIKHRNIKNRKTRLCVDCAKKSNARNTSERNRSRAGDNIVTRKGYLMQMDGYRKYIFSHRRAMAHHLGRKLEKGEVVHHIDFDKHNNQITNLYLTDPAGHSRAHTSLEKLARELYIQGKVIFNIETGEYEFNKVML